MKKQRVLTGITTSGIPHLGNYAGAIRPCIEASRQEQVDSFLFLADYHALIKCTDPQRVAKARLAIAATWLAAGLDPQRVTFYCQSHIPEITELNWMLNCLTPKGLMNRAHAYKAAVDQNVEKGVDIDDAVTMGLFCYPILMAADILMFNATTIPVGRDQIQHIEMARDIAMRFNHHYKGDFFVLPQAHIEDSVAILPGLDGRKMSKSYDNTIPLFEGGAKALKEAIAKVQTDSLLPGQAKDPDQSHLFTLYRAFATAEQTATFRQALLDGLGWGEAKEQLFTLLNTTLAPMREQYEYYMARPDDIQDILLIGAQKARAIAIPLMERLRHAVGLYLEAPQVAQPVKRKSVKAARFVSFRDDDGHFRFRLVDATGQEMLLSEAFTDPKQAGSMMRQLQDQPTQVQCRQGEVWLDGFKIATTSATQDDIIATLHTI